MKPESLTAMLDEIAKMSEFRLDVISNYTNGMLIDGWQERCIETAKFQHSLMQEKIDALIAALKVADESFNAIYNNRNMTIYNHSEEFMSGANVGYTQQAEIAQESQTKIAEIINSIKGQS